MSHLLSERRFKILAGAAIATAAAYQLPTTVDAAALYNVKILASDTAGGTYSPSLNVSAGEQVFYQIVGNYSPFGTVNTLTNNTGPNTLTSLTSADGGIGFKWDMFEQSTDQIQVGFPATGGTPTSTSGTLVNGWTTGTGASGGNIALRAGGNGTTDTNLTAIRPAFATSTQSPLTEHVIMTGSFTVNSTGSGAATALSLRFFSGGSSTFKINNGKLISGSNGTELGADPFTRLTPLTLTAGGGGVTPEPASLSLLGLAGLGLLARRRDKK